MGENQTLVEKKEDDAPMPEKETESGTPLGVGENNAAAKETESGSPLEGGESGTTVDKPESGTTGEGEVEGEGEGRTGKVETHRGRGGRKEGVDHGHHKTDASHAHVCTVYMYVHVSHVH